MHFGQVEECKSSDENLACDVCTPNPPNLEENNVIFYFNISLYLDNKLFFFFKKDFMGIENLISVFHNHLT